MCVEARKTRPFMCFNYSCWNIILNWPEIANTLLIDVVFCTVTHWFRLILFSLFLLFPTNFQTIFYQIFMRKRFFWERGSPDEVFVQSGTTLSIFFSSSTLLLFFYSFFWGLFYSDGFGEKNSSMKLKRFSLLFQHWINTQFDWSERFFSSRKTHNFINWILYLFRSQTFIQTTRWKMYVC